MKIAFYLLFVSVMSASAADISVSYKCKANDGTSFSLNINSNGKRTVTDSSGTVTASLVNTPTGIPANPSKGAQFFEAKGWGGDDGTKVYLELPTSLTNSASEFSVTDVSTDDDGGILPPVDYNCSR